jgi:hypothetical protein
VSANGSDWGYRDSLFAYLGEELRDAQPAGDRVWLVLTLDTDSNGQPTRESAMLRAVYGKGRRLIEEKRISTITILLYARDASASAKPLANQLIHCCLPYSDRIESACTATPAAIEAGLLAWNTPR